MTDDHELDGLDPFDILDGEAARLDRHFAGLAGEDWARPSRCAGWSVRDVLAHLTASEEYNEACLAGTVGDFLRRLGEAGATDLDAANAMGVAAYAGRGAQDILDEWRRRNAATRLALRDRRATDIDTSVGAYPCRWQTFHLASELATHGDDVGIAVDPAERAGRLNWRARFSRFALAETKPEVEITTEGNHTTARLGATSATVDDPTLVEAVAARLDQSSGLSADQRALLSTMP